MTHKNENPAASATDWLNKCHFGDVRDVLRQMIADGVKVQTIVTSPPYWGLRSYLPVGHADKHLELGSEPTLQEFIRSMTEVMMLAREVLEDDGTMWMNMGDCYASGNLSKPTRKSGNSFSNNTAPALIAPGLQSGLKSKDLVGQPWRLAFALQDAGWWLRQDIIWHKPNPMPESCRDRCTKSHEYLFLLSKSERYYYNFDAMQEPVTGNANARRATIKSPDGWDTGAGAHGTVHREGREKGKTKAYAGNGVGFGHGYDAPVVDRVSTPKAALAISGNDGGYADGKSERMGRGAGWRVKNNESMDEALSDVVNTRNRRSVWTIPTQGYDGAHFATFPEALVEPCVLAGCKPGGTVLDIFFGSGTTGQVAQRLGFNWIGIDLDARNEALQRERLSQPSLDLEAA